MPEPSFTVTPELKARIDRYDKLLDSLLNSQKELQGNPNIDESQFREANHLLCSAAVALHQAKKWADSGERPSNVPADNATLDQQVGMAERLYNQAVKETNQLTMTDDEQVAAQFSLFGDYLLSPSGAQRQPRQAHKFVRRMKDHMPSRQTVRHQAGSALSWLQSRADASAHRPPAVSRLDVTDTSPSEASDRRTL